MTKKIICEKVSCDLCACKKNKKLYRIPDLRLKNFESLYTVVECLECGHRFLSPRPIQECIAHFYPDSYYNNRKSDSDRQQHTYTQRRMYLPQNVDAKILDIGCAGGAWLKTLDKNWQRYGTDLFQSPYEEKDIHIEIGLLPDMDFDEEQFDVITAWGVIEHVYKPSEYFERVNRLLKNTGLFIFLVPNGDSLWSRWAYKEDIPRHLHFFRKRTVMQYAEKFGFSVGTIEFPNAIYSKPATGRGAFRRNMLLKAGVSWQDIAENRGRGKYKLIGKLGSLLDAYLIHPAIEEMLGLSGNMVVMLRKRIKNAE